MGYILDHAEGIIKIVIFTPFLVQKLTQKFYFCTKCLGLFPEATYRHVYGNYGSFLDTRLRDLFIFIIFSPFWGVEGVRNRFSLIVSYITM